MSDPIDLLRRELQHQPVDEDAALEATQRKARRRSMKRRAGLVTAAVVMVGIVVAAVGPWHGPTTIPRASQGPTSGEVAACSATLTFMGQQYVGNKVADRRLVMTQRIGSGTVPSCEPEDGTSPADIDVVVFRIRRIRPAIAVALEGQPDVVYVAQGQCLGYRKTTRFLACLRHQ